MADFSDIDPWTQVINQLWALLEANEDFAALVKPSNRVKFTEQAEQNPIKNNIQDGDCPECLIEPTTSKERQAFTSVEAASEQSFSVQLTTLDMRLRKADKTGAENLRWLVWQILDNAGDTLGLDFVYKARLTTSMTHYVDPVTRGTRGWVVFVTVACTLALPKTYLLGPISAPVVVSVDTVTGVVNSLFVYQIMATNDPTSYSVLNLPAGLSLDATTGLISGAPAASGQSVFTVQATNAIGTGSKDVTLTTAADWTQNVWNSATGTPWFVGVFP
jgi:hypothetical protein